MGAYAYYWTAEGGVYAQFSRASATVTAGAKTDPRAALSVRYVRHA
jgi:hypothetical protein